MKLKEAQNKAVPKSVSTVLLAVYYTVACTYIPLILSFDLNEWLSGVISLALGICGIVLLARLAGTYRAILVYSAILGVTVLCGGSLLPVGIFAAFASASCVYAFLLLKRYSHVLWGLPLLPVIFVSLAAPSPVFIVLSLAVPACALPLAYSVKNRLGRIGAVCRLSFGICALAVAVLAAAVYELQGELSISAAKELADTLRGQLISLLSEAVSELNAATGLGITDGDIGAYVTTAVDSLFNLLPAIVITVGNVLAYVIHSLFLGIYCVTDEERKNSVEMLTMEMSLTSAIVFILSLVLSLTLVSDSTALYGTAAENILVILCPGLILMALSALRAFIFRKKPSCSGTLIYLLIIFLLASFSAVAFIGVALAGAILVIVTHILSARSDKDRRR